MSDSNQTPQDLLKSYVSKHGLKLTKQRQRIADVFLACEEHITVEQLLDRVRQVDKRVSLATVYRTIKLLTDCGLAQPHRFDNWQIVYEPARGKEHHHDHMICMDCNRIIEFVDDQVEELQLEIAKRYGFTLESHRLELYGHCHQPGCPSYEDKPKS